MKVETYRFCLSAIEDRFSKPYHKDVKNANWPEFKELPDKAFELAVDIILLSFQKGTATILPRMDQLLNLVKEQAKKIWRAEADELKRKSDREKQEYKTISQFQPASEFAKMLYALWQEMNTGKIDRLTFILTGIQIAEHYNNEEMKATWEKDLKEY